MTDDWFDVPLSQASQSPKQKKASKPKGSNKRAQVLKPVTEDEAEASSDNGTLKPQRKRAKKEKEKEQKLTNSNAFKPKRGPNGGGAKKAGGGNAV